MYRIILSFIILLVLLTVLSGHMNYFWHEKDIDVVDDKGVEHDMGAGRFWFGFHATDLHVRTDAGVSTPYPNFRSLTIYPDGQPDKQPISTSRN